MARPVNFAMHEGVEPRGAGTTWTGGQYSLVRALFGTWLLAGFVRWLLLPAHELEQAVDPVPSERLFRVVPNVLDWSAEPWLVTTLLVLGVVASVLFAAGAWHRAAAGVLAYLWISLSNYFPELPTPGVPWIVILLLAHLTLPPAPYGSWAARGRADPEGAWRMHLPVFQLAWVMLLLGSVIDVFSKASSESWRDGSALSGSWLPQPLSAALVWIGIAAEGTLPFLMFRGRTRALGWSAGLLWRLAILLLGGADDRLRGLLMVQLYAFDPLWLPPLRARTREHFFFDGQCGLCHRLVRFVAAEDRGSAFFYSPLQGETIRELIPDAERAKLPDTVVVRTDDARLLLRSDAAIHVLRRIGGAWRAIGAALAAIPRPLRDLGYRGVARARGYVFARPDGSCPLLSSRLRTYFLP